jgi:ferrous iron transport protein A
VPTSQHAEVVTVEGGRGARRHLAQLGIQPGGVLLVVRSAPMGGPILVEVRGSTVAVGRGLACKIRVRLL